MRTLALLVALVVAACGCMGGNTQPPRPPDAAAALPSAGGASDAAAVVQAAVYLGNPEAKVRVTLARTEEEQRRGLMYVQNLPVDAGMLFIFPDEEKRVFWMHNTLIWLDMIFIRSDLTVAGVVPNAQPLTDTMRSVNAPSQYVLEVNGTWAQAHGVTAGSRVRFEGI